MPERLTVRSQVAISSGPAKSAPGWQKEVRHQVALWGRVTDAGTGTAVGRALVTIEDDEGTPAAFRRLLRVREMQYTRTTLPDRPDQTHTAADGIFYFLDLPEGDYTLSASLPKKGQRYSAAEAKATVSCDKNGDYRRAFLELALRATTVRGRIMGPGHKNGVAMAEVRVKGSGERTFTDPQGEYVLSGLELGKRTVLAFAQGYRPASQVVELREAGSSRPLDFELVREAG